ncbi:MAG: hypothetical protein P8X39_13150 [Desulfofustis sp.]
MTENSPIGGDKLKKAELIELHPEKSRLELLEKIQLKFDLSPADCEFLDRHLREES